MALFLSDTEIESLIKEEKHTRLLQKEIWVLKEKGVHKEHEFIINRDDGSQFKIILRQNSLNIFDFSVILSFVPKGSNQDFKLRRYNGKSHQHTNKIEKETFYDFHIHQATERYQNFGSKEESFAKTTKRYSDIKMAFNCLMQDCNIIFESENQLGLEL